MPITIKQRQLCEAKAHNIQIGFGDDQNTLEDYIKQIFPQRLQELKEEEAAFDAVVQEQIAQIAANNLVKTSGEGLNCLLNALLGEGTPLRYQQASLFREELFSFIRFLNENGRQLGELGEFDKQVAGRTLGDAELNLIVLLLNRPIHIITLEHEGSNKKMVQLRGLDFALGALGYTDRAALLTDLAEWNKKQYPESSGASSKKNLLFQKAEEYKDQQDAMLLANAANHYERASVNTEQIEQLVADVLAKGDAETAYAQFLEHERSAIMGIVQAKADDPNLMMDWVYNECSEMKPKTAQTEAGTTKPVLAQQQAQRSNIAAQIAANTPISHENKLKQRILDHRLARSFQAFANPDAQARHAFLLNHGQPSSQWKVSAADAPFDVSMPEKDAWDFEEARQYREKQLAAEIEKLDQEIAPLEGFFRTHGGDAQKLIERVVQNNAFLLSELKKLHPPKTLTHFFTPEVMSIANGFGGEVQYSAVIQAINKLPVATKNAVCKILQEGLDLRLEMGKLQAKKQALNSSSTSSQQTGLAAQQLKQKKQIDSEKIQAEITAATQAFREFKKDNWQPVESKKKELTILNVESEILKAGHFICLSWEQVYQKHKQALDDLFQKILNYQAPDWNYTVDYFTSNQLDPQLDKALRTLYPEVENIVRAELNAWTDVCRDLNALHKQQIQNQQAIDQLEASAPEAMRKAWQAVVDYDAKFNISVLQQEKDDAEQALMRARAGGGDIGLAAALMVATPDPVSVAERTLEEAKQKLSEAKMNRGPLVRAIKDEAPLPLEKKEEAIKLACDQYTKKMPKLKIQKEELNRKTTEGLPTTPIAALSQKIVQQELLIIPLLPQATAHLNEEHCVLFVDYLIHQIEAYKALKHDTDSAVLKDYELLLAAVLDRRFQMGKVPTDPEVKAAYDRRIGTILDKETKLKSDLYHTRNVSNNQFLLPEAERAKLKTGNVEPERKVQITQKQSADKKTVTFKIDSDVTMNDINAYLQNELITDNEGRQIRMKAEKAESPGSRAQYQIASFYVTPEGEKRAEDIGYTNKMLEKIAEAMEHSVKIRLVDAHISTKLKM